MSRHPVCWRALARESLLMPPERPIGNRLDYSTRRLRRGRISSPGEIYLLTAVTRCRAPVFADFTAARWMIQAFSSCRHDAKTLCFVVMPDHFHWLVQLGDQLTLHQLAAKAKAQASRRLGRHRNEQIDSLWQDGFHDFRLRPDDDPRACARYVIRNPIRAGLVNSVRDYPHWDALWI